MSSPSSSSSVELGLGTHGKHQLHADDISMNSLLRRNERYRRLGTTVRESVGQGSYGVVYPCWDNAKGELRAIKVQPADSDEAIRELMFLHSIGRHPNLIVVVDAFCDKNDLCIVLEYVETTVFRLYKEARFMLGYDLCRRYSRQMFSGLAHLHDHGIAHRDLHMGNLLVSIRDNVIKVADLGLSVTASDFVLDRPLCPELQRPPEVVLSGRGPTQLLQAPTTIDLWSSGCIVGALWLGCDIFAVETQGWQGLVTAQAALLGYPGEVCATCSSDPRPGSASCTCWPGCSALPLWGSWTRPSLESQLGKRKALEYLRSKAHFTRPLLPKDSIGSLILGLLRWNPAVRIRAIDAAGHHALQDVGPACAAGEMESSEGRRGTMPVPPPHEKHHAKHNCSPARRPLHLRLPSLTTWSISRWQGCAVAGAIAVTPCARRTSAAQARRYVRGQSWEGSCSVSAASARRWSVRTVGLAATRVGGAQRCCCLLLFDFALNEGIRR